MKNYCPLPFGHVCVNTLGDYQVCCQHRAPPEHLQNISDTRPVEWFNNKYLQEVQQAFLNDQRHPGCYMCWRDEDQGKSSMRSRISQEHRLLGLRPGEIKTVNVEIQAGNLCNLSCIMCSEIDSSVILAENQRLGINRIQPSDVKWNDAAWHNLEEVLALNPRILNIRGGEPLYNKKLLEIVESIPQERCESMLLHITTNATAWSDRWARALERFRVVRIMMSIDAVGPVYEYIRHPGKWSTVDQNVDQMLKMPNLKLVVYSLVQNLNISNLELLVDWCQEKNIFLQFQKLYSHKYLELTNIPEHMVDSTIEQLHRCRNKLTDPKIQKFIESCIEDLDQRKVRGFNPALWNEFVEQMSIRESLRGNDHRNIISY